MYELQVSCGSLGHKSVDGNVFGSKRVTFVDDKSFGLVGEIVNASAETLNNNDQFRHLIEHALACTLERKDEDVLYVSELRFEQSMRCLM